MPETADSLSSDWDLSCSEETTSCGSWTVSCTTLAKLSRLRYGEPTIIQPTIVTSVSNSSFVLAVDNVCVFLSENQEVLRIPLKHRIDDLSMLEGGYIVIGDSEGTLMTAVIHSDGDHGLKLSGKSLQKLIQNNDSDDEPSFRRILISHQPDGCTAQIVVLTTNGLLVTVSGIVLLESDMDISSATISTASVSLKAIDVINCQEGLCILNNDNTISLWEWIDGQLEMTASTVPDDGFDLTQIFPIANGQSFFTLDSKGNLYLWDVLTLIPVCSWSLSDFGNSDIGMQIIHSPGSNDLFDISDIKLVLCTEKTVRVVKLPSMESCFEQRLDGTVKLSKSAFTQEDIYVTECKSEYDEDDSETLTTVKFMYFTETSPEQKLMKLIAKKKFEEAEQLIKLYGLQYNLVPHLVQQNMYEALPSANEVQERLLSSRKQIDACDQDESLVRHTSHELSILEDRFAALLKVFGHKGYSPSLWQKFQQESISSLIYELLISERPENAFTLWRCFQPECSASICEQRILQMLPNSVPVKNVLDWLCVDIIPFLVHKGKQAWDVIINWTLQYVASMEYQNEAEWPSSAISFCETFLECLQENLDLGTDNTVLLRDEKLCIDTDSLLKSVRELLASLRKLAMLKEKFKCDFSLDIVKKETKESIVYRMLDKLASVEMLGSTLRLQIRPYMEYCGLNADRIFAQYVKDLLDRLVQGRAGGSGWECKIQALIEIIKDPVEKITAVLNLVNHAPLPIPNFVADVVKITQDTISHPLKSQLEQSWCIKEADNLTVVYGLEPMLKTRAQVETNARYFIYQDKTSSLEHARKILRSKKIEDEAFLVKCQTHFYMREKKLPELLNYMKSLKPELRRTCTKFCIGLAETILTEDISSKFGQAMKKTIKTYCSAGVLVANYFKKFLVNDELELAEIETSLRLLEKALELLVEFNLGIDQNTLYDESHCMELFLGKIGELKENAAFRLANLLGISQDIAVQYLVERAVTQRDFDAVDFLMGKFSCSHNPASKCAKISTAKHLLNSQHAELIAIVYKLSSQECTHCPPSDIETWLSLSQRAKMLKQLCQYSQTKPARTGTVTSEQLQEKGEWLDDFYQEMRLPFQSDSIVGDTNHLLQAVSETAGHGDADVSTSQAVQEIVPCLSAHGHDQLAFELLHSLLAREQIRQTMARTTQQASRNLQIEELLKMWKKTATQIFCKILRSIPVDYKQALGYALIHSEKECVTLLSSEGKSCGINFQRLKRVCAIGTAMSEILQDEHLMISFRLAYQKAKWGHRLAKLGIPFKEALDGSHLVCLHIADRLVQHPQCSVGVLKEYFQDLNLDNLFFQGVCVKLFRILLFQPEVTPADMEKAQNVLQHIIDESQQLTVIKELFAETSSYNYEVLHFLLELWQDREPASDFKGLELLRMLKMYKRQAEPSQTEIEEELAADGQAVDIDSNAAKLSHDRLPFHSLMSNKPWKFIGPELHLNNLQFWLSVVAVINIPKDDLLIKVASNLVKSYMESKCSSDTILQSVSLPGNHKVCPEFLNTLNDVSQALTRVERLEAAVFWCHATADRFQKVEERVTALHYTTNLAKKWLESAEEPLDKKKAERSLKLLSKKLPPLSIQWSLIKCGLWSNEELRPLVKDPKELLQKLYQLAPTLEVEDEHRTIMEEAIHEACEEIAEVNQLDLLDMQTGLVDSWLSGSSSFDDADQTMTFGLCNADTNSSESNLKRILFLLKSSNGPHLLEQVSDVAKMREGPMSLASRKMAVVCLLKSASVDEIKELMNKSHQELQQELKILVQLSVLELHNVRYTPETFKLIDKESFVQSVWSKLKYHRETVPIIASICLENNILQSELWNSILQQMIRLNLKEEHGQHQDYTWIFAV